MVIVIQRSKIMCQTLNKYGDVPIFNMSVGLKHGEPPSPPLFYMYFYIIYISCISCMCVGILYILM